ncbi:MAG: 5-formyltetrahydrofolate cyclo-ligase, partial [Kiloniellaceae bacterium]
MPADPAETAVQDAKRRLRAAARATRAAAAEMDAQAQIPAAQAVCDRFLAAVAVVPGTLISAYWPMADEIDPRPLMEALRGRGHPLALPAIRAAGQPLDFRA